MHVSMALGEIPIKGNFFSKREIPFESRNRKLSNGLIMQVSVEFQLQYWTFFYMLFTSFLQDTVHLKFESIGLFPPELQHLEN